MRLSTLSLRSSLLLLLLISIISVAFNFYLYQQSSKYYLELNATRLDPLGLSYEWTDLPEPNLKADKRRVLFFGDSRTAEWVNPEGFEQYQFINRGIGAQTTTQVLSRFQTHVAPLLPNVLVLQVGINDLKTIPLFPEHEQRIIENCKTNIRQIVDLSVANGADVIVVTIFPLGQLPLERRIFWSDRVAIDIRDVNQFLVSLQSEHVKILDSAAILANQDGIVNPIYSRDFLHLNGSGYEALNQELRNVLSQL